MNQKRLIEFTTDGLRVPYRCADGVEVSIIVQYAGICNDRVTVSGERGTNVPKEVFGAVLRALYGEEPRFENPAPPIPAISEPAQAPPSEQGESAEKPPILDASESTAGQPQ